MDKEFIKAVAEDLLWLRDEWRDAMDEGSLRRGSATLRGLVAESWMYRVRNELDLGDVALKVDAPNMEPYLRSGDMRKVVYMVAGGGSHGGVCYVLNSLSQGPSGPDLLDEFDRTDTHNYTFRLQSYFDSPAIYVGGFVASRQEVIQYVANKLGAAHYDSDRSDKQIYQVLDDYRKVMTIGGSGGKMSVTVEGSRTNGLDLVYYELLSIGQRIGKSHAADRLIQAANEVGAVDL